MSNTINHAIAYIKTPAELEKVLAQNVKTVDLEVPNFAIGAKTVRYQHIEFGSATMSAYNRATGYVNNDITLTWKELTLTQDVGNSLYIDKMDDEEVMGLSIVRIANRYIATVQAPEVDKYRFGVMITKANIQSSQTALNANNIVESVLSARASIKDEKINSDAFILYCSNQVEAILKTAALKQGYWQLGSWNGSENDVNMFDGIKVVAVRSELLNGGKTGAGFNTNANISAVLVAKEAVPAMVKYAETEYFDRIPGFGGRKAEADIGIYHDCFVYDELAKGVYAFGTLPVANNA